MKTPWIHASLFSGIGGFDFPAEWMGWKNAFHCELNKFGQKVLGYYWPNAITYGDITKTDFTVWRNRIDILTGGFPCQPYSQAGKRLGKEDDRHLWPEMFRAVREIQPIYIVGENVPGLIDWNGGLVFDEVQADMEAEGYEVQPVVLPACGKDAPHRRDRIWFVAYSEIADKQRDRICEKQQKREVGRQGSGSNGKGVIADSSNARTENMRSERENTIHGSQTIADTTGKGLPKRVQGGVESIQGEAGASERDIMFTRGNPTGDWKEFPTQSPVCGGNDGLPSQLDGITFPKWRKESIAAYGNAVVPQVAYEIFKAIQAADRQMDKKTEIL